MYDSYGGKENNLDAIDNHFIKNAKFECLDFERKIKRKWRVLTPGSTYLFCCIDVHLYLYRYL